MLKKLTRANSSVLKQLGENLGYDRDIYSTWVIAGIIFVLLSGCVNEKSIFHKNGEVIFGGQRMQQEELVARFKLASGVVELNVLDLEAIRKGVIAYLKAPDKSFHEFLAFREQFLKELEVADCVIGMDGTARIDAWILEQNADATGLILVRHPTSRTAIMYLFYANLLEVREGEWKVISFAQKRVSALR